MTGRRQILGLVLGGFIALGLGVHFRAAINQPWFGDEISSLWFANDHTIGELLTTQAEADHQNTFYLLVKIIFSVWPSTQGLRLVMLGIFGLTTVVVWQWIGLLATKPWQRGVGLAFWVWSAYVLRLSYLVRMYGLGLLWAALSLWLITRWVVKGNGRDRWLSLLGDILGVLMVFGYWYLVGIKYFALLWWHWRQKRRVEKLLWVELGLWAAGLVMMVVGWSRRDNFNQSFTWWMPPLRANMLFSMLSALLGLTSSSFFEGYTDQPPSLLLGMVMILGMGLGVFLSGKQKKAQQSLWLESLLWGGLGIYLGVFLGQWLIAIPGFHVRQLFPVAVVLTIGLPAWLLTMTNRYKVIFWVGLVVMFGLMVRRTLPFGQAGFTAYPQRYMDPPNDLRWISLTDIELGFDHCRAYSAKDMVVKCGELGYALARAEGLQNAIGSRETFSVTTTVYELFKPQLAPVCQSIGVDYYRCHLGAIID
jgi:hypothetical protein